MTKIFVFILFFIFTANSLSLDSLLIKSITDMGYDTSNIGFILTDLTENREVASLNSNKKFIPASTEKLFTGALAFDTLGRNYTFKTDVFIDSLEKSSGKVIGNIYIKGYGDPGFTAEQLWLLLYQLKIKGVKSIHDTLFIDNSYFDSIYNGPGFANEKSSRSYMAPVAPLSLNFNAIALHITPKNIGEDALLTFLPPQDTITIEGKITTTSKNQQGGVSVSTYYNGVTTVVKIGGSISNTSKGKAVYRKVWDPVQNFGRGFISTAKEVGINVDSLIISRRVVPHAMIESPFISYDSKALYELVNGMFKYSNNFIAEMIFKTISAESDTVGSWTQSSKIAHTWWKSIDTLSSPTFANGSGMENVNHVTPNELNNLLFYAEKHNDWWPEFLVALPVAGEDGTLAHRFNTSILAGKLRAKTGTLQSYGVSNLAGYIFKDNKIYSFVFFVQSKKFGLYSHWKLQEQVLENLYHSIK